MENVEFAAQSTPVQVIIAVFFLIGLAGFVASFLGIAKLFKSARAMQVTLKTLQDKQR